MMTAIPAKGSRPDDVATGQMQPVGPARAMLVPMRELPKQATIDQDFSVPSELSNCIIVADTQCCIGRRPVGTKLTCTVPEKWTAMSSCHGLIRWEDGNIVFRDTSSNGTFRSNDHTTQELFTRLPKGEPTALQVGDYIMFSQWSNNRTNDELLIYHIQEIPEKADVKYTKRSPMHAKDVSMKSKTPKSTTKSIPTSAAKSIGGGMAPCKHCAKQAADAISARQDLASEQHKTIALAKELDSFRQKAVDTAAEIDGLREQLTCHAQVQEKLSQAAAELELSREAKDSEVAASRKKDEKHQIELASIREIADRAEAEKTALSEQLQMAQSEVQKVTCQLQKAQVHAKSKEADFQEEISKLQEQNRALKQEQEQRDNSEVVKLKEEHEAETSRLRQTQLRLEKEAAAWRLKTETVSRTLPDALEKSMIPQLHKAARQCIHSLLQDVNALNDTTASDLFGGTPTNVDKLPCKERVDHVGNPGPSQHTVCFSSPGNLAAAGPDVPQTEMFEGGTGLADGTAGPSQEEQGPSVSLRNGFAASQGYSAPNKDDGGQALKEPASPLLDGFMRAGKGTSTCAPAQNEDGETALMGMMTDETRLSDQKLEDEAGLLGRKRNWSGASAEDEEGPDANERFAKVTKIGQQNAHSEEIITKGAELSDQDSMEDRSTSALAERLKAIKNHETVTC